MVVKKFSDKDVYKLFLKDKVGIRCNTKAKCQALANFIIEFIENDRKMTDSEMEDYKEDTCISCKLKYGWSYSSSDYYKENNIPLAEFDDVIELED